MNHQELAHLLFQTQSMIAPSRTGYHQSSGSVSEPPLSPRQKFQSHIRTLSEHPPSPSRNASTSPLISPQLQHVSSLRVQRSQSPSPTPRNHLWRSSESTLETSSDGPQFDTEEREVWGRPSPLRSTRSFADDTFHLQSSDDQSPLQNRYLRPFGPSSRPIDIDDRPKTRHGPKRRNSSFAIEHETIRPSKFAEGSMNDRSAGISSTWNEHGSLASTYGTDESDNDSTPRASLQRSSIDIDEFNPQPVAAPTFTQRLFKFGTKAKSKDVSKQEATKSEQEPQTVRRKKGLRKSMSMWTLHGDKKKAASQLDLNNTSPEKKHALPTQVDDLDVLNDRKRRAEEAYAQQISTKRRKSNVGVATSNDLSPDKALAAARGRTPAKATPNSSRRRLSSSSSTNFTSNFETYDGVSDVDLQKRPSRRELEKENQQLRAMLRQQEDSRSSTRTPQPSSPSSRFLPKAPGYSHNDSTPPRRSSSKQSRDTIGKESQSAPPVPALSPERGVLKPLSNTRNVPQRRSSHEELKTIPEDVNERGRPPRKGLAKNSRRASLARGGELPRPPSMILEQDEESEAEKNAVKEKKNLLKDIPKLDPTPHVSPKKLLKTEEIKIHEDGAVQKQDGRKKSWEWPDDVF